MTSALEKISVIIAERESLSEAVETDIFVDVAWNNKASLKQKRLTTDVKC